MDNDSLIKIILTLTKVIEVEKRTFLWQDEPESSGGRETSLLVHLTTPSRTLSRRRGACSSIKPSPSSTSSGRGRALKESLDVVRSREKGLKGGNVHFVVSTSPNNFRFDKPAIYSRTRLRRQIFCVVKLTVFILVVSYLPVGRTDFQAWTKKLRSQNSRDEAWHEKSSRTCLEKG